MRSATSYFNGTLYRKTLARFWPLWGAYGVIWLFAVPLNFLSVYLTRYTSTPPQKRLLDAALNLPGVTSLGLYLAAGFAVLCAMAVFGYLYNSRSACWTHALPLRREALFTTQYLAGLSFLLLPQLAAAVLTAMVEVAFLPMEHWSKVLWALLVWLLAQSGICLFFFSFAAFCAMFTGHILALPAFYGILNMLAEVIYTLVDLLMQEFFFGYAGSPGAAQVVEYLTPCAALNEAVTWWSTGAEPAQFTSSAHFTSPGTIAVYAAVGVVLALASLYVYRRRHVETAGDVVAIPLVRPLFKYGVSFCSGLCLGMFTIAFFGWSEMPLLIPSVLFWTVIGCFAAEMLLKKSFRVLRHWRGPAVMAVVMLLLCLGCTVDLFGVEARVPKAGSVEALTVQMDMGYPSDSGAFLSATLTDPEDIQKFLALHQAIVDDRDRLDRDSKTYQSGGDDYAYITLWYNLKGGGQMNRRYRSIPLYLEEADAAGSVTNQFKAVYEDRDLAAQAYSFEGFLKGGRLTGAWLSRLNDANGNLCGVDVYVDEYARELWDAVQADFAEGTIGVRYLFDSEEARQENTCVTDLYFSVTSVFDLDEAMTGEVNYTRSSTLTITLTPQASHTLAVLEKAGVFEEGYALAFRGSRADEGFPDTVSANW